MSPSQKRTYAAAAFITLLTLSVFWPSPVVSINLLWVNDDIAIDQLSFLGREAPSWDVAFWCLAGLLLITILRSADVDADPRELRRQLRTFRPGRGAWRREVLGLVIGAAITTVVWLYLDARVLAWAEGVRTEWMGDVIRILNRLGGGMNPVLIVAFFAVAGIAYLEKRWVAYAVAMGIAGLAAGVIGQLVKHLVGRARPELWLGPMHYAPGSATSFPSGHTVGAFALAGVLLYGSRSVPLRIVALILASAIGLSRVFAFRHWLSDVTASAAIGLVTAWAVWRAMEQEEIEGAKRPQP